MRTFSETAGVRMGGVVALCATLMCVGVARGQGVGQPPDYAWEWATITHPGNAPVSEAQTPGWINSLGNYERRWSGSVNYAYRIAKTEVTCSQYAEFLNAYAQAFNLSSPSTSVTGEFLLWRPVGTGLPARYEVPVGAENLAINPSGRMAFRMANWLHNDKATDQASFLTGAYDIASVLNASGQWTSIPSRSSGARFWIPSIDEWAKAVYYDPNRYGPGQEGYWNYPNSSDSPLISGTLSDGGQTLAGVAPSPSVFYQDVGTYVNVTTPWGLLDASGGWSEWTEKAAGSSAAWVLGSGQFGPAVDRIDSNSTIQSFAVSSFGFRFATSVPSPGTVGALTVFVSILQRRRRAEDSSNRRDFHAGSV